jgi:hypothetical protein
MILIVSIFILGILIYIASRYFNFDFDEKFEDLDKEGYDVGNLHIGGK